MRRCCIPRTSCFESLFQKCESEMRNCFRALGDLQSVQRIHGNLLAMSALRDDQEIECMAMKTGFVFAAFAASEAKENED